MSRAWTKLFFALTSSALTISNGHTSEFELETVKTHESPTQLKTISKTEPPIELRKSNSIPIPNNQSSQIATKPSNENHSKLRKLETKLEKEKEILLVKGPKAIKGHAEDCFDALYCIFKEQQQDLRLYIWTISFLATDGNTEEETLENYLTAARHLKKIRSIVNWLDITSLTNIPEFQVKIESSDELETSLDEKINGKLYDFLEKRFLDELSAKKPNLSSYDKFISDFLNVQENKPLYDAIEQSYGQKIVILFDKYCHNKSGDGDFDFSFD